MAKLTDRVSKIEAQISSASMADIAFLLIVFFMVTAVFSATKGLDFKLPSDEDAPQTDQEEEAIFFKVYADGTFTMDGQPGTKEGIIDYVLPKLKNWADKPIIIYSEPEAPYQGMITIYDQLTRMAKPTGEGGLGMLAKSPNISIPTQSEVNKYIELFGYNPFERMQ